jgi:hypothetical protein
MPEPALTPRLRLADDSHRIPALRPINQDGNFSGVTNAAQPTADDPLIAPSRDNSVSLGQAARSGLRQPIVTISPLIALFTAISGKPLDGFLKLTVATRLIRDAAGPGCPSRAAQRRHRYATSTRGPGRPQLDSHR